MWYLNNQIRRIKEVNVPIIKVNNSKTIRNIKNSLSLPIIYDKQILNHKISYYSGKRKRIIDEIKRIKPKEKNKYLSEKIFDYKIFPK